jgi:hypothetical protein
MLSTSRIKQVAAALLVLSLALPAYTCSGYVAPDGSTVSEVPPGANPAAYTPTRIPHYAIEKWAPTEGRFWLAILAFGWPIPLLLLQRRSTARTSPWLWRAEPICALAAGWFIVVSASVGRLASGTYVALGATAALLIAWLIEASRAWVRRPSRALAHDPGG